MCVGYDSLWTRDWIFIIKMQVSICWFYRWYHREMVPWISHIFETGAAICIDVSAVRETARAQTRSWQQTNINNNFITVKHFHPFPAPKLKQIGLIKLPTVTGNWTMALDLVELMMWADVVGSVSADSGKLGWISGMPHCQDQNTSNTSGHSYSPASLYWHH